MKKYIVPFVLLGLAVLVPKPAFAVFQSISRTTSTAVASLTGAGLTQMNILLKSLSDNSTTTQIYWTGVILPASFTTANAYVQLFSTMTASGGGIQIYTDNKAADAVPAYTGTSNPAGLVNASATTRTLPIVWSIKATTGTAPVAADPDRVCPQAPGGVDPNAFQWLFFKDRGTPSGGTSPCGDALTAFADGDVFTTVKQAGNGIHFGQGPGDFGPASSPNYIYAETNFSNAVTPNTYKTSTLRLEAYTQ